MRGRADGRAHGSARVDIRDARNAAAAESSPTPSHDGVGRFRALKKNYPNFECGIHTAEHTDMTSRPVADLHTEMVRANERARIELGDKLRHFSYPYSKDDAASQGLVRALGYESAVTSGDEILVSEDSDRYRLLRLEPHDNVAMLRYWTSGAHPALPRMVFGRA